MHSGVPARYWDYAVEYATFLENVARPHHRGSLLTPYAVFYGKAPVAGFVKPFGCYCVAHLGKERVKDGKWSERGRPGIFMGVGFDDGFKAYRVLDPETRQLIHAVPSRIRFDTSYFPFRGTGSGPPRFPSINIPLEEEVVEAQDDDTQPEASRRRRSRVRQASRRRRRERQASVFLPLRHSNHLRVWQDQSHRYEPRLCRV